MHPTRPQRVAPRWSASPASGRSLSSLLVAALAMVLVACPTPDDRAVDPEATPERETVELTGIVYTADEGDNAVTMVELGTGQTRQTALPISPHNIQISDDGSLLFLVGALAGEEGVGHVHGAEAEGRIVVLDPETLEEALPAIVAGDHPAHVVVDADNRSAFVTDSGRNSVLVVDLEAARVDREIPTCGYPHGLRLSPEGGELYVACVQSDEVAVIDVAAGIEAARIEVGRAPVQVGFTPDGGEVWVSLRDDDAVAVIDTGTREVVEKVAVGRGPIQVFGTPDGRSMYVANEGTEAEPDNTVSVVDVEARRMVATITTDAGAHGVVVSTDGELAFVSNLFAGTISVIEVAGQSVVASFPVGEAPAGITYRPAGTPASGQ
jgi:YVTN family beta-propeller protein